MKLGFLENVAICTPQTKGLKKGFVGSQTPSLRQLSDELSVKVSETSGSHFPSNSQEHRGGEKNGAGEHLAKAPP